MRLQKCFIAAAAVILAGPLGQAQQTFRVVTYNVENFILEPIQNRPLKKPFAQAKIIESILAAKPDVIALQEMGKKTALAKLQANEQILFQYATETGDLTDEANPNGSLLNIAGICNEGRNVCGMMPHPERASENVLGADDGRRVFESMLRHLEAKTGVGQAATAEV